MSLRKYAYCENRSDFPDVKAKNREKKMHDQYKSFKAKLFCVYHNWLNRSGGVSTCRQDVAFLKAMSNKVAFSPFPLSDLGLFL